MTIRSATNPSHVVIAGGGVAAPETMMALRHAEPFLIADARHGALVAIAADFDARHVRMLAAGAGHAA